MKKLVLALAAAGLALPALAANVTVYSNDFSAGAGSAWSNATTSATPTGQAFLGEFSNDSTTLTLNNLGAHSAVTISFDLYILKSWDGDSFTSYSPDVWGITLNGATSINTFTTTFSNGYGATQSYPSAYFAGQAAARTGSAANDTLGYAGLQGGNTNWGDSIYHMSFTTTHNASTFTAKLFGSNLQGVGDESWGVDNVKVTVSAVPEPETYTMLLAGLGLMGAVARRRKQK